ncbi:HvfX family Cu-binding RiPP maturation protein [Shewanella surugensis]|uniref:DoxX family protein n=1 Tax=Shewanella surugensis TaxID=212020 RepID=A0ABT0L7I9_9GAMM|nr:DoxX family protein [Shewanella surugensis]MCL1123661.1 DoxX family protein [Shewanella surugensis]
MSITQLYQGFLKALHYAEGLAPLALRLYLAPVLMQAGYNKWIHFSDTVAWFGNSYWGLGLPFPALLAGVAVATEFIGGLLLIIGLATRLIAIPMMITMLVAAFSVHWENGWLAIADHTSWLANADILNAAEKLSRAKAILQEHGNYEWLTSSGNIVIINNGIEFAITYFCMLLALLFMGGGRYTSVDYVIAKRNGLL